MPGKRRAQGNKRKSSVVQNSAETSVSTENGYSPMPHKRKAGGSGDAIQAAQSGSTRRKYVSLKTESVFHEGSTYSSSDPSAYSSVEARTPQPSSRSSLPIEHNSRDANSLSSVYEKVFQRAVETKLDPLEAEDARKLFPSSSQIASNEEPLESQEAHILQDIGQEEEVDEEESDEIPDTEAYSVLEYSVRRRLECDFLYAKKIELEDEEGEESFDSEFELWESKKVLRFLKLTVPAKLMNVYRLFTLTGQFLENLFNRNLRTNNSGCKIFLSEFVGMSDELYDEVLRKLWITKNGSEDGYERWQGRDFHLAENEDESFPNVVREEEVPFNQDGEEEVPEEDEEVEDEEQDDQAPEAGVEEEIVEDDDEEEDQVPEASMEEEIVEDDEEEENQVPEANAEEEIVEEEGDFYMDLNLSEDASMADAAPVEAQPVLEQDMKQEGLQDYQDNEDFEHNDVKEHRNLHPENFVFVPDLTASSIEIPRVPAPAPPDATPAVRDHLLQDYRQHGSGNPTTPSPAPAPPAPLVQAPPERSDQQQAPEVLAPALPVASPAVPHVQDPSERTDQQGFQILHRREEQQFPEIMAPSPLVELARQRFSRSLAAAVPSLDAHVRHWGREQQVHGTPFQPPLAPMVPYAQFPPQHQVPGMLAPAQPDAHVLDLLRQGRLDEVFGNSRLVAQAPAALAPVPIIPQAQAPPQRREQQVPGIPSLHHSAPMFPHAPQWRVQQQVPGTPDPAQSAAHLEMRDHLVFGFASQAPTASVVVDLGLAVQVSAQRVPARPAPQQRREQQIPGVFAHPPLAPSQMVPRLEILAIPPPDPAPVVPRLELLDLPRRVQHQAPRVLDHPPPDPAPIDPPVQAPPRGLQANEHLVLMPAQFQCQPYTPPPYKPPQ